MNNILDLPNLEYLVLGAYSFLLIIISRFESMNS